MYTSFNQDFSCIAIGNGNGFEIYNSEHFNLLLKHEMKDGVFIVEMLNKCNILAYVANSQKQKLIIWDSHTRKILGQLLFLEDIKGLKLYDKQIVVVLELKIYIYNLNTLKLKYYMDTLPNLNGLSSMGSFKNIIACPGPKIGQVQIYFYDTHKSVLIQTHDGPLSCISLNLDGSLLATASIKGTLIRIFNTKTCEKIQEFRRGSTFAEIYSLHFDEYSNWLVCCSSQGTLHIFKITTLSFEVFNIKSYATRLLPSYFTSQWSFAQFRFSRNVPSIACFTKNNNIVIIGKDGNHQCVKFNPNDLVNPIQDQVELIN